MEQAIKQMRIEKDFGKEEEWFPEEKQTFALMETEIFNGILEANEWKEIRIPNDLLLKWEDEYQTRLPHFSDTAFFTLMIARGLKTLDK